MILLYHKVHPEQKSEWWVTVDTFHQHMLDLRGRRVVYLDDYDPSDPQQVVITFDGVYRNVLEYAVPLMERFGYPFELFVTGDYLGKDNAFDHPEPLAPFASMDELAEMVRRGGRIQWHTRSHPRVSLVTDRSVLEHELTPPEEIRALDPNGCRWFAYPHGEFGEEGLRMVRERFAGALSCIQGRDDDRYQWNRLTVKEGIPVTSRKVSVIIPCYNYGRFLAEAVDSVLRQIRLPDEILISDDASTDDTRDIAQFFAGQYPDLIRVNTNESNLGIVKHFNRAISLTSGDYVMFLGADNRLRSDYLSKTCEALDLHPEAAIAYTDFALFGPRARIVHESFLRSNSGSVIENELFLVRFPDFDEAAKARLLRGDNFIHGSSLYRRSAFEQAGGYQDRTDRAEDHALFTRMISAGWSARRVAEPLLEYRQHSEMQDSIALGTHLELRHLRKKAARLEEAVASRDVKIATLREKNAKLQRKLDEARTRLRTVEKSLTWKLTKPLRKVTRLWQRPHRRTPSVPAAGEKVSPVPDKPKDGDKRPG